MLKRMITANNPSLTGRDIDKMIKEINVFIEDELEGKKLTVKGVGESQK